MWLLKYIEKEKYIKDKFILKNLFCQSCDFQDESTDEKSMSFNQFSAFCSTFQIFSRESQEKFENFVPFWDRIRNIEHL
jgi:hypothetical protein